MCGTENRLTGVSGGANASFVYDGDGNRVKGTVNGVATSYYYAGSTRVAMRQGGVVSYLHGDHLGSASLTTDANGAPTSQLRYLPYGAPRPGYPSGSVPTDYRFTGQRSEEASLGSLYDFGARPYSPVLGRFLSADTIVPSPGNPQSLNRYSYVYNNPLKFIDPTGHHEECSYGEGCGQEGTGSPPPPPPPPPPPWYTPYVVGAAQAWWKLTEVSEARRYATPIDVSLYGSPLSPDGVTLKYSLPTVDIDMGWAESARFTGGAGSPVRIDQSRLAFKLKNSEGQVDTSGQGIAIFKGDPVDIINNGTTVVTARSRSVVSGRPLPPACYQLESRVGNQVNFRALSTDLEVTSELRVSATVHGGPTIMAAVPVGVYLGWGVLTAIASGTAEFVQRMQPQQVQQGWGTP